MSVDIETEAPPTEDAGPRRRVAPLVVYAIALLVVAYASYASRSSVYNALYGPFRLDPSEYQKATALSSFGLRRDFVVEGDMYEDSGWEQFTTQGDALTRVEVTIDRPRRFYVVHFGGELVAVESTRSPDDATFRGRLHPMPEKLLVLLKRSEPSARMPRFLLQERDSGEWSWLIDLGGAIGLMALFIWLISREIRSLWRDGSEEASAQPAPESAAPQYDEN